MAHQIDTDMALSVTATPRSSQELIKSIYDELGVPSDEREKHYSPLAHRIRRFCERKRSSTTPIRPIRKPQSLVSSRSTSSSARSSRTSSHLSFASSRASYGSSHSSASQSSFQTPVNAAVITNASSSRLAPLAEDETPPAIPPSNTVDRPRTPVKGTGYPCPWCNVSIGKLHDFKRHVYIYCCGRRIWVCQNPGCTHSTYQKKQANEHCHHTGNAVCKGLRWKTVDLHCDRRHFGCAYCASYFSDLDGFLHHLTKDCGPEHLEDRGHQSSRIIALLQQPMLLPQVEVLSLELRHSRHAYLRLHWSWTEPYLAGLIEQLEYGVKARVDRRNPGIAVDQVDEFLRLLITPSRGSLHVMEFATGYARMTALTESRSKPLPPLPGSGSVHDEHMGSRQPRAQQYAAEHDRLTDNGEDMHATANVAAELPRHTTSHPQNTSQYELGLPINEEPPNSADFPSNTPSTDLYDLMNNNSEFAWQHLANTMCTDLLADPAYAVAVEPWSLAADAHGDLATGAMVMETVVPLEVDPTAISPQISNLMNPGALIDPSLL